MLLARAKAFIGSSSVVRGVTVGAVERSTGLVAWMAGLLEPAAALEGVPSAVGAGGVFTAETSDSAEAGLMAKVGVTVDASLAASGDDFEAASCSRRFFAPKKISGQRIGISHAKRNHGPGTLSGKLLKNKAGFSSKWSGHWLRVALSQN